MLKEKERMVKESQARVSLTVAYCSIVTSVPRSETNFQRDKVFCALSEI